MGVLKNITDEYFGDMTREEDYNDDFIKENGLRHVEICQFKDNNRTYHKHGYRIEETDNDGYPLGVYVMAGELKRLIEAIIEKRGVKCSLNDIDVSNIKDMHFHYTNNRGEWVDCGVFYKSKFNGDISGWDVSNVKDMSYMFYGSSFNGDISGWDVSNVKDMSYMFCRSNFNGDLSWWNMQNVEDTTYMFYKSKYTGRNGIFNIKNNSVAKGIRMLGTFEDSKNFDCDLSKWDVSNVSTMANMFSGTKFNHDISNWKIDDDCVVRDMFSKTPIRKNNNLPQWYLDKSEW